MENLPVSIVRYNQARLVSKNFRNKIVGSLSFILLVLLSFPSFPQSATYSKEEEKMIQFVNMGMYYAIKYDSTQNFKPVVDSCRRFLKNYPYSFARPNVYSFMLEMTSVLTRNMQEINPLVDSVLHYDKLPVTQLRIGEILIKRNLDIRRGRMLVASAFPKLTVPYHIYNSYMLMARADISLGNFASAKMNFEKALSQDSTRTEAWYEYLAFLQMREFSDETELVKIKIKMLEKQGLLKYIGDAKISPNINRNIYNVMLNDLDNKPVSFKHFEGKVVVLNCFNFWCGYCRMEFPTLKKMIKEFPEVEFVFINCGETTSELRQRYFSKKEFSFLKKQTVVSLDRPYTREVHYTGVPATLVVDRSGNIRYDYVGYKSQLEELLRSNLSRMLKE